MARSREPDARAAGERTVRRVIGVLAFLFVLAGLAVYLLQGWLGIAADTARLVSSALLLVGIADTLVLYFWNRIVGRRP
jgi:hypothetical protein